MRKIVQITLGVAVLCSLPQVGRGQERSEVLERLFSRLDRNGDGVIEESEAPAELWSRLSAADSNKDGKIDKDEAATAGKSMSQRAGRPPRPTGQPSGQEKQAGRERASAAISPERLKQLFARFGKDGEGKVALTELPEPLRDRLAKLDTNQDQTLDRAELKAAPLSSLMGEAAGGGAMLERMKQMLLRWDDDGDGKVALADLPEPVRERVSKADANTDGLIEVSELSKSFGEASKAANGPDKKPLQARYFGGADDSTAPQKPKRPATENENESE
jgi:Ca2+-binding EF-hand superfamily protein